MDLVLLCNKSSNKILSLLLQRYFIKQKEQLYGKAALYIYSIGINNEKT